MNMQCLRKLLFVLFISMSGPLSVSAQADEFQTANRYMEQQEYSAALPILKDLVQNYPDAGIFFERMLDCLINLKELDEAIGLTESRMESGEVSVQLQIRLADLHYLNGQKERAVTMWHEILESHSQNLQVYFNVGNSMSARREHSEAVTVYELARRRFNDPTIFTNELADTQLQAGNFSGAIEEYIGLIRINPTLLGSVQQKLIGMQDQELYGIAAIQLEDYLMELDTDEASYAILHQLLIWMLMETEQYERALVNARQFESGTDIINYSLYSVGGQLLSNNRFELSAEAYGFYLTKKDSPIRYQAMEQQALVYQKWAEYLSENSLETSVRTEELIRTAYELNSSLLEEARNYEYRGRILIRQSEIALDTFHDVAEADKWAEAIKVDTNGEISRNPDYNYILGRIHLAGKSYAEARRFLTRANRDSEDSAIVEKTRYFLSLSDFFAGEFDFARIQLRSIERRSTSTYANDALKLGLWIQEGLQYDSTGAALSSFSKMMESLLNGDKNSAVSRLAALAEDDNNPLVDDAIVEVVSRAEATLLPYLYALVSRFNSEFRHTPLRERLLWEQAVIVDLFKNVADSGAPVEIFFPKSAAGTFHLEPETFTYDRPPGSEIAETLYEKLIMEFPAGFYAPYARELLQTSTGNGI